jgi:hypothetical protein
MLSRPMHRTEVTGRIASIHQKSRRCPLFRRLRGPKSRPERNVSGQAHTVTIHKSITRKHNRCLAATDDNTVLLNWKTYTQRTF